MNDRVSGVVWVIYGAVLGWYVWDWWKREKERIVWDTCNELHRREQWLKEHPPQPVPEASVST